MEPIRPLMEVKHLTKRYRDNSYLRRTSVQALNSISVTIPYSQTIGIVGESGSGKSTLGRIMTNLERPDEGDILYQEVSLKRMTQRERKEFRRNVQIIFQDPVSSLNPRFNVEQILSEPFYLQNKPLFRDKGALKQRILEMLREVGLEPSLLDHLPRNMSGGQCQRVSISRAFALKPKLIVCDESLSALDISVQTTMIALLKRLQRDHGTSYMFITHDLKVARAICDYIYVMKDGQVVDEGSPSYLMNESMQPYVQELRNAILELRQSPALTARG
ncbi:ABC transporter ATP-binding protein [Alicyclobacillus sp. SO9]|uniref:ABC transporter ATP-binding protein n=1 Tax=Alicyclobacillus sp. SO9 TaxID=2665646 RepID=UPI0018E6E084|nr:dipeptide/oligopeptide/nickel ABC transporter ATP-binding protein [Alicyclobacillus sp. SO9]QQE78203.1 ABC transporter ATP-binding protein [Alicyclobacillus sp. SO9]